MLLWRDRWIHGFSVEDIAPMIFALVDTRTINRRTVQQAFVEEQWIEDIQNTTSFMAQVQLMHLRHAIATVRRDCNALDVFSWPCATAEVYSARSTYSRLCQGLTRSPHAPAIWRRWAPLKCKIFTWFAAQYRLWTSDRHAHHGLLHMPPRRRQCQSHFSVVCLCATNLALLPGHAATSD